jgi:hypothetical protein
LAALQEAGKYELVAAILQLPAVLQSCRSHMEDIITVVFTVEPLYRMLVLESPLVSDLISFKFLPRSRPIPPLVL